MELTLGGFDYLGHCLEGFFFGTISVNFQAQFSKIVPFQDSIPEYLQCIYNISVNHNKALVGQKTSFSMPFGCYTL